MIRPSSRQEIGSERYKVDCEEVSTADFLIVNISHEDKSFIKTYRFSGVDLNGKSSIHVEVQESNSALEISWSGALPID